MVRIQPNYPDGSLVGFHPSGLDAFQEKAKKLAY
jgi:hypothetical protein